MRAAGLSHSRTPLQVNEEDNIEAQQKRRWYKGVSVSVYGLVASNIGGLAALIIGVVLVYGRGSYFEIGYFNYLLAITIARCIASKSLEYPHSISVEVG